MLNSIFYLIFLVFISIIVLVCARFYLKRLNEDSLLAQKQNIDHRLNDIYELLLSIKEDSSYER